MAPGLQEVIFETWLYKYQGAEGRHTLRLSSGWKRRYIILLRHGNKACVQYYEKKPSSLEDIPKGRVNLDVWFMVTKRAEYRGRKHVCQVITSTNKLLILSTEEEKMFHLLSFFLQTQIKLKEETETSCFVVRPDGSDDHMKLGSRGSMCLMHISKGGITIAIQLSRCVLTQWPLSCIKLYDGEMRGQFLIETGNNAPTGRGKYIFNTRHDENKSIYDLLDSHVMELAGLKQIAMQRTSAQTDTLENVIGQQYAALQELVQPESDPRFISHLKKVSRGIYDQLAEHLGATSHSRLNVSTSEPTGESGPPMMRFAPRRSASQSNPHPNCKLKPDDFNSMSLGRRPHDPQPEPPSPLELKAGPLPKLRNKVPSGKQSTNGDARLKQPMTKQKMSSPRDDIPSQYLHMEEPPVKGPSGLFDDVCYMAASNDAGMYYNTNTRGGYSLQKGQEVTERSRSPDSEYTRMSNEPSTSYNNGSFHAEEINLTKKSMSSAFNDYSKARGSMENLRLSDLPTGTDEVNTSLRKNTNIHSPHKADQERSKVILKSSPVELYQDMTGSPPNNNMTRESPARPKVTSHEYGNFEMKSLQRQHSRSLEDLPMEYAVMTGSPHKSEASASIKQKELSNTYGNQDIYLLRRQHSRSCEDLSSKYAPMSGSPNKTEVKASARPKVHSNTYSNVPGKPHNQHSSSFADLSTKYAPMTGSETVLGGHWSLHEAGPPDPLGVRSTGRHLSRSCEDLGAEYAEMSAEFVTYENEYDLTKNRSVRPQVKPATHGNKSLALQRHHSRSCENLPEYALMSGDAILYANNVFRRSSADQRYDYANPSDLDLANGAAYSQILRDKSALYTTSVPKEFRRSQSLSNMIGTDPINSWKPPVLPKPSQNAANRSNVSSNDTRAGIAVRPDNIDFSKLKQSTPKKTSRQISATSEGSSTESYTVVGKSKFWETSLAESPTKILTPMSTKGISMTSETRVFSRRISNDKSAATRGSSDNPDNRFEGSVEMRHEDASSSSMKGRRLPSLPADAHLSIPGLNPKSTVC